MKTISTEKAPAAIGPYSQGIIAGGFLFASGQIPINPENGEIEATTIADQADRVCRNIGEIGCYLSGGHSFPGVEDDLQEKLTFSHTISLYF